MLRAAYRLPFRILGIPIEIHISFLLILPVFAFVIGANLETFVDQFGLDVDPTRLEGEGFRFLLGLVAVVGLFASVLVHELGHCVVGRALGMKIRVITLWLLGGMAQFEKLPRRRGHEALMAIAGPITSLAIAGVFWGALALTPRDLAAPVFVMAYLMWMNVILAGFNLLPALPLDGGRVFRSLLALRWSYLEATQTAVRVSKALAFALGIVGILGGQGGIWLVILAFFIYMAVVAEGQLTTVAEVLRGIDVGDLMTRDVKTVAPETPLTELMHRMIEEKHLAYPVVSGEGDLLGVVTLGAVQGRIREAPELELTVRDVMSAEFGAIRPGESALEAFERITREDLGRLLVIDDERRLRGIISKTDLVRAVQVRLVEFSLRDGAGAKAETA